MKYQSHNTRLIHELDFNSGKYYKCPECTEARKKHNKKDLEYFKETNTAYCFHCNTTFYEYKPYEVNKVYTVPKWENITKLSDKAVKYFTSRMISQITLNKMQVYTKTEWMPQFSKDVETICFPYFRKKELVNIKYRAVKKAFKLVSGAELIWYNFDALLNHKEIIICEGEIDVLTWIENGFDNVLSVPNGAGNKLEYLDNSIDLFKDIEKIYLSTDVDTKGIELRDELIRRLGAEKCYLLNFKQYKDANDYFCGYGGLEFKKLINDSKPAPIKGIIKIESIYNDIINLYENGEKPGLTIKNPVFDEVFTWELGRLLICTGVPGSGKSELIDYFVCRLNLLYGYKAAYFTPENYPLQYHYRKLHSKYSGKSFEKKYDNTDFFSIYEHIKYNFFYILDDQDMTVDTVLNAALQLIKSKGIKILVIDPYNKLEHQFSSNTTETQYISKFLDKITNIARFYNILVILIAHPVKMQKGDIPTLYNISGSANFYNKTDYGMTMHRVKDNETGLMTNEVEVYIQKVKFKHLGNQGVCKVKYNFINGRFEDVFDVHNFDNSNWLKQPESIQDEFDFSDVKDIPF